MADWSKIKPGFEDPIGKRPVDNPDRAVVQDEAPGVQTDVVLEEAPPITNGGEVKAGFGVPNWVMILAVGGVLFWLNNRYKWIKF